VQPAIKVASEQLVLLKVVSVHFHAPQPILLDCSIRDYCVSGCQTNCYSRITISLEAHRRSSYFIYVGSNPSTDCEHATYKARNFQDSSTMLYCKWRSHFWELNETVSPEELLQTHPLLTHLLHGEESFLRR